MPKNTSAALMSVEHWPVDRPIPYARNARKISQSAVAKVAASIKEFGWQQPIVVDTEDVIIVGHTRLRAAQLLKLETVPVVVAGDLTANQVKAYRLADNRTNDEATFDNVLLALELSDLSTVDDLDILITGFEADEIGTLLTNLPAEPKADEAPTEQADESDQIKEQYQILVKCADEAAQLAGIDLLQANGFDCRALIA